MSEQIRVEHATLHTAANDLRAVRGAIETRLTLLGGVVDELETGWQGVSGTGFQELMDRWNGDVSRLLTSMGNIADLLDRSANTHQANDDQQQAMLDRFHAALGGTGTA